MIYHTCHATCCDRLWLNSFNMTSEMKMVMELFNAWPRATVQQFAGSLLAVRGSSLAVRKQFASSSRAVQAVVRAVRKFERQFER